MSTLSPETIDEAAQWLLVRLTDDERAELRALCREDLIETHFTLGAMLRNELGLWRSSSPLTRPAEGSYIGLEPDEVSAKIIERAWERLQEAG